MSDFRTSNVRLSGYLGGAGGGAPSASIPVFRFQTGVFRGGSPDCLRRSKSPESGVFRDSPGFPAARRVVRYMSGFPGMYKSHRSADRRQPSSGRASSRSAGRVWWSIGRPKNCRLPRGSTPSPRCRGGGQGPRQAGDCHSGATVRPSVVMVSQGNRGNRGNRRDPLPPPESCRVLPDPYPPEGDWSPARSLCTANFGGLVVVLSGSHRPRRLGA